VAIVFWGNKTEKDFWKRSNSYINFLQKNNKCSTRSLSFNEQKKEFKKDKLEELTSSPSIRFHFFVFFHSFLVVLDHTSLALVNAPFESPNHLQIIV